MAARPPSSSCLRWSCRSEYNVLINPAHADAKGITAQKMRKWLYDPRILGK